MNSGFEPSELAVTSTVARYQLSNPSPGYAEKVIFNVLSVYKKGRKVDWLYFAATTSMFYNNMSNLAQSDGLVQAGLCNLLAQIISMRLNKMSREVFM